MPERWFEDESPFVRSVANAAFTIAAFFYASGFFLVIEKQLRFLPPTAASGIGRVTIEHASKAHDYAAFALFLLIGSAGTLLLREAMGRLFSRFVPKNGDAAAALRYRLTFALPFLLSPFLWLTTGKEAFTILFPPALAVGAILLHGERIRNARRSLSLGGGAFAALLLCEIVSWILFRYLATGKRIAHIPTLFLELIFLLFFLAIGVGAALLAARMMVIVSALRTERALAIVALSLWPFLLLLPAGIALVPPSSAILLVIALTLMSALLIRRRSRPEGLAPRLREVVAWLIWPAILFCFSYASTASINPWLDLFHRGETLGPASDYLRGKVPYRDVFVLHGMLEDGLLDSWLMGVFGRDATVALARITLLGATTLPILYLLALSVFESIGVALATVALGLFTFVDNQRIVFHLLVVLLLVLAYRGRRLAALAAGLAAGLASAVAIFYSLDIGLYAVAGSLLAVAVLALADRSRRKFHLRTGLLYLSGLLAGAIPFLGFLNAQGALPQFAHTSFIEIPAVIDAVWSLPFPDLAAPFRNDLSLRTLSTFVLGESLRFVLNPLVLAIGLLFVLLRLRKREVGHETIMATLLLSAALFAQRSALGRADFQHQYFAAYLLSPVLMLLFLAAARQMRQWRSEAGVIAFTTSLLLGFSALCFTFFWVPDLLNSRLDAFVQYRPRVSSLIYADPQADEVAARIVAVQGAVASTIPKGASLFDFSNQPALYFFSDRPNPTRFYQIPIASPPASQREIIRALTRARTPLIFRSSPEGFDRFDGVSNEQRAPLLASFIDRHYQFERRVRGIEFWTRRPEGGVEELPAARSTAPASISFAPETEWLFPAVGSAVGAADSFWKSDLVVTNPDAQPISIRLRYYGNEGNADRGLVVPSHGTVVLPDLVATFFHRPGTRGYCTLRFPSDRRPMVSLTSYDAARSESASTELPLQSSEHARGGTKRNRLMLNGLAESPTRRVNIGILNVGQVPATFTLSVQTASGAAIGVPLRGTLDEGKTQLLVSAGATLGVPLRQDLVVVFDVSRGDCVAYASVVDAVSGAHFSVPASVVSGTP